LGAVVYYAVLSAIVFCINLIKKRKIKWMIFTLLNILFLIVMIDIGFNALEENPLDIFVGDSAVNIPFLPFVEPPFASGIKRIAYVYLIYFGGALLYWYLAYRLSQRLSRYKYTACASQYKRCMETIK
jgi:hypothetical protein